jgi:hypothetical protein
MILPELPASRQAGIFAVLIFSYFQFRSLVTASSHFHLSHYSLLYLSFYYFSIRDLSLVSLDAEASWRHRTSGLSLPVRNNMLHGRIVRFPDQPSLRSDIGFEVKVFLFYNCVCALFQDAVRLSDYIASNSRKAGWLVGLFMLLPLWA